MRTVILYHQAKPSIDCPDGIAAAWVACQYFQATSNEIKVVGVSHRSESEYDDAFMPPIGDDPNIHLVIVDFSYPAPVLRRLSERVLRLTVIDHHKTRQQDLSQAAVFGRGVLLYEPQECGATAAWKHFFPKEAAPWFLEHVRNRDIGANGYYSGQIPGSEAINEAISFRRKGLRGANAFQVFDRLLQESSKTLLSQGRILLEKSQKTVRETVGGWNGTLAEVSGHQVPYLHVTNPSAQRLYSKIGNELASQNPQFPFVAIRVGNAKSVELRSTSSSPVDCGEIAKSLGGGGHKAAAGYQADRAILISPSGNKSVEYL